MPVLWFMADEAELSIDWSRRSRTRVAPVQSPQVIAHYLESDVVEDQIDRFVVAIEFVVTWFAMLLLICPGCSLPWKRGWG